MASNPSTGFQYAPVASDDIGRRFERNIIPTPTGTGFDVNVADALQNGPTSNVLAGAKMTIAKIAGDEPGQEELIKQRKEQQGQINDLLDRIPSGFISGTSAYAGQALGFALDPANIAATIAAPELIGERVAGTVSALAERATANQVISRAVTGGITAGVEGGAIMAPGALTHLAIADPYKEDFNSLDAFSQIGVGAALGGALGGAGSLFKSVKHSDLGLRSIPPVMRKMIQPIVNRVGAGFGGTIKMGDEDVIKPFDQPGVRQAQSTAAAQLAAGKAVNVDGMVTNSFNAAKDLESEPQIDVNSGTPMETSQRPSLQKAEQIRQDSVQKAFKANEELESAKQDFNKTLKESPKKGTAPIEPLDTETIINRVGDISQKSRESGFGDLNAYEKEFIGRNARTPDLDKARRILGGDPLTFSEKDATFINELNKNEEPRLRAQQEKITNDVSTLQQKLKTTGTRDLKFSLKSRIKPKIESLKHIQRRLDALEKVKEKTPTPLEDSMRNVQEKETKRFQADQDLKDAVVGQKVLETPHQPITGAEVRSQGQRMMSPESNFDPSFDQEAFPGSGQEIPGEPGLLKEDRDLFDQLKEGGELSDADVEAEQAVQEELQNQEGYTKLIDQMVQCLRGSL